MSAKTRIDRRGFLKKSAIGALGAGMGAAASLSPAAQGAKAEPRLGAGREGGRPLPGRHDCHDCRACEPACPYGVPVDAIMRCYAQFAAQGREKEAMVRYAAIPGLRADICSGCRGSCEAACPHGVRIRGLLAAAHRLLTLA